MSTPPNDPYAHNPESDNNPSGTPGSGSSPYGPAGGQSDTSGGSGYPGGMNQPPAGQSPPGQPYGQRPGAQMPYSGYTPQQPSYQNAPYTGGGMGWGANASKNALGGWALGTGIAGVLCCGIAAVPALILGIQGRKAADEGLATNRSMATTGMVLGIVGIALWGIALLLNLTTGLGSLYLDTY